MILGVGTILVFTGLAVLHVEVDQNQHADKRNQSHEDEPTTLADVLQAAYGNGQSRKKYEQRIERAEFVEANRMAYTTHYKGDDEIEEHKVPKLCTGCTTVEINVVLQAIKKILH